MTPFVSNDNGFSPWMVTRTARMITIHTQRLIVITTIHETTKRVRMRIITMDRLPDAGRMPRGTVLLVAPLRLETDQPAAAIRGKEKPEQPLTRLAEKREPVLPDPRARPEDEEMVARIRTENSLLPANVSVSLA